jgi:hypothetical protein
VVRGGIGHVVKWSAEFYGKGSAWCGSWRFIRKEREEVHSNKKKKHDNDINNE